MSSQKEVRRERKKTLNKVDWVMRVARQTSASIEDLCMRAGIQFNKIKAIAANIRDVHEKRNPRNFRVPNVLLDTIKGICKDLRRQARTQVPEPRRKQVMHRAVMARRMA